MKPESVNVAGQPYDRAFLEEEGGGAYKLHTAEDLARRPDLAPEALLECYVPRRELEKRK